MMTRKQSSRCWLALALALALLVAATPASATVIGIDLGGEFIKIAAPNGNTIEIALNEQSLRKSSSFVGFRGPERYFGEEARSLTARFPDNMVTMLNRLVGVPFNDTETIDYVTKGMHYKLQLSENPEKGTVNVRIGTGGSIVEYSAEELLGMIFTYIKATAEKHIDGPVREATVTIPQFLTPRQRQAIIDAAALAGLRVVSLMHSTTATAHLYGIQNRGFGDETRTVLFYDMGTTLTEVGIYTFSPPQASQKSRKPKFSEGLGVITTLGIVSDPFLGGRVFDTCLAEMIENEFVAKTGLPRVLGGETLPLRKSVISLMRAANKVKEMLSANKQAPITVEGLAPDRDFTTTVTREAFEKHCAPLFQRAIDLVEAAVAKAGIRKFTIQRFELMGGGVRIPKLVHDLGVAFGRVPDRTLNSDEAAAIGAGYFAASHSGHFRLKGFGIKEKLPFNVSFQLSPRPEKPDEVPTIRPLFVNALVPSRKSINVNRTEDFDVRLLVDDALDVTARVTGVRAALDAVDYFDRKEAASENNTHSIKIELRASESGLVTVEVAEAIITYAANVSKKVRVNKTEDELAAEVAAAEAADAAAAAAAAKTAEGNPAEDAAAKDPTEADGVAKKPAKKAPSAKKSILPYKFVKRSVIEMKKKIAPLKVAPVFAFPPTMSKAEAVASRDKLRALNAADDLKRATAAAKNDLETYLMWVRGEGVLGHAEMTEKTIAPPALETLKEVVASVSSWFEDDATDATTRDEYAEKLAAVKRAVKVAISGEAAAAAADALAPSTTTTIATDPVTPATESGATASDDAAGNEPTESNAESDGASDDGSVDGSDGASGDAKADDAPKEEEEEL